MKRIGWVALWFGGSSYAPSYMSDHAEYFPSLEAAKRELGRRYMGWAEIRRIYFGRHDCLARISEDREFTRTPAVDESCFMDLDPLYSYGTYGEFSKRIEFGPRGGMRVVNA